MSDDQHNWQVVRDVCGWHVEHSGPTKMRFQPSQFGNLGAMSFRHGHGAPPLSFKQLRDRLRVVHTRLHGKRFGDRFSDIRRNVCCEYAAELNDTMGEGA